MFRRSRAVLLSSILVAVGSSSALAFGATTVALSEDPAPGTPPGVVFGQLGLYDSEDGDWSVNAQVNDAGQVRFMPLLAGPGVTAANDVGVFGFDPVSGIAFGMREGEPAPGHPPNTTRSPNRFVVARSALASDGASAFFGSTNGPGGFRQGVFRTNVAGGADELLFGGDAAPGLPAGVLVGIVRTDWIAGPTLASSASDDEAWLHATLTGSGVNTINDEAIFGPDGAGGVTLLLRSGTLLPPVTQVHAFHRVAARPDCLAFHAPLAGASSAQDESLWRWDAGVTTLLGREGFSAPGYGAGVLLTSDLFDLELNAACRALFATRMQGAGVSSANDDVLYVSDPGGGLVPLVREGDPAPDLPGVVLGWLGARGERALNAEGAVAFVAALVGSGITSANDMAVYLTDGVTSQRMAREGDVPVNAPAAVLIEIRDPLLDDAGRVAFSARLHEPATARFYEAIVLAPGNGKLYELVSEGELLTVAPGDVREIDAIAYAAVPENPTPVVSGSGKVLFHATFTDGSDGLFLRDVAEIVGPLPDCDDGLDNDGDGLVDDAADPGCETASSALENPKCDDDLDNDGDATIDWDGGSGAGTPDPQCAGQPWRNKEAPDPCGLGAEIALVGIALRWRHRAARRARTS